MKQTKLIPTLLAISFICALWQLITVSINFPDIFPSLNNLIKQVFNLLLSENFFLVISSTIFRGTLGFGFAFTFAFTFAYIAVFSSFWKAFFNPIIVLSRSIPVISLVLIALLWLSPPQLPVFIAVITMFPILYQNILTGLEQTDNRFLEMATVFGKTKSNQFFNIYLPSAKNVIYDGIKTAMGFGWRAIIIGEALAQPVHGIGTAMKQAQAYINVSELIAWTVVAIGISYFFEYVIKQIQKIHFERQFLTELKFEPIKIIQNSDIKEIILNNLSKKFNDLIVLESINTVFNSQKISCIKGPSGKGKTTLLRLLAGLEKPDNGKIISSTKLRLGYSFQDVRLLPWLTVSENIAYVFDSNRVNRQTINKIVVLLELKMELNEQAHKYPHELSGGQQQRVGLARALAIQSDILLFDEPLTGLDNKLKIRIIDFISEWIDCYNPLVVWATHENIELKNADVVEVYV